MNNALTIDLSELFKQAQVQVEEQVKLQKIAQELKAEHAASIQLISQTERLANEQVSRIQSETEKKVRELKNQVKTDYETKLREHGITKQSIRFDDMFKAIDTKAVTPALQTVGGIIGHGFNLVRGAVNRTKSGFEQVTK